MQPMYDAEKPKRDSAQLSDRFRIINSGNILGYGLLAIVEYISL